MTDGVTLDPDVEVSEELFAHLPSGLDICYQTFGDPNDETILLIMGLGGPMGWWATSFCQELAARGFFVVRFDNRDTGRSTKLRHHRVSRVQLAKALLGRSSGPYSLQDMADDALGLLDHLEIAAAHIVGVSMGGMIAQTIAISRPERVLSLVSMLSTTGKRTVGWTNPRIYRTMLRGGGRTRSEYVDYSVQLEKLVGSPAFPTDESRIRERAIETYDRGRIASGVTRHLLAVLTQPDRTTALGAVIAPTLVIHGSADPLVHKSGGKATASAIPGSTHLQIAGLGHDLPIQLQRTFIDAIVATTERAS